MHRATGLEIHAPSTIPLCVCFVSWLSSVIVTYMFLFFSEIVVYMHAPFLHDILYPVLFIINTFAIVFMHPHSHMGTRLCVCVSACLCENAVMILAKKVYCIITHCKYESSKQ